jgi:hypothetical protein
MMRRRLVLRERWFPQAIDGTFRRGQGGFPEKGSFPWGNIIAEDDDIIEDWMQHHGEKRMGVP